jgi:hypothetical protein
MVAGNDHVFIVICSWEWKFKRQDAEVLCFAAGLYSTETAPRPLDPWDTFLTIDLENISKPLSQLPIVSP